MTSHGMPCIPTEFPMGWSYDEDHGTPRLVYYKVDKSGHSACFIYYKYELIQHLQTQCLTNLEYLEGLEFYTKVGIQQRREDALMAIKPRDMYFTEGADITITRE